jgi:hypothetical protein
MSQFPHDEFAKNLFELLLTPLGGVEIEHGVQPEAKAVDIYFQPSKPLPIEHNIGLLASERLRKLIEELVRRMDKIEQEMAELRTENELLKE